MDNADDKRDFNIEQAEPDEISMPDLETYEDEPEAPCRFGAERGYVGEPQRKGFAILIFAVQWVLQPPVQEDREDEFDAEDQFNAKNEAARVFGQFDFNKDGTITTQEMVTWFPLVKP